MMSGVLPRIVCVAYEWILMSLKATACSALIRIYTAFLCFVLLFACLFALNSICN